VLKNLPLKLTALGLAFLLWFHVVTDKTYDYRAELAFRAAPLPAGWVLTDPLPETIRLQVHGSGKELMRLLWEGGTAELLVEPGLHEQITVTAAHLQLNMDAEVGVQRVIDPTHVMVSVDSLVRQPKRVRFQGEYATSPGLSLVRPPVLVPDQVMLAGPKARVEAVAAVNTVPVDLRLLTESVSREVSLELGQAYNVKATPATVRLELEVAPTVRREVSGVPVQVPAGWMADPPEVTLGVAGAAERLGGLGAEYYRAAVTLPPSVRPDSLYTVHATVPPLVEILSVHPDRVRIRRR
jgi:hypothetical protein